MTFAEPMSPEVENLTPSFVTLMSTLSPMVARSLHRRQEPAKSGNTAYNTASSTTPGCIIFETLYSFIPMQQPSIW